jgi:hypothetical protein
LKTKGVFMNAQERKLSVAVLALSLTMLLSACGQNKDQGTAGRANVSGQFTAPQNAGAYSAGATYITSSSNNNFSQSVIDMISANYDPQGVGAISDTSVIMSSYIELGSGQSGGINLAPSRLRLWVYDSYAQQNVNMGNGQSAQPYYFELNGAVSGSFTGNQFTAVFRDANREFTLTGTYDQSSAYGTLSSRNLTDFNGSGIKSAQPLGSFNISVCALLNCGHH